MPCLIVWMRSTVKEVLPLHVQEVHSVYARYLIIIITTINIAFCCLYCHLLYAVWLSFASHHHAHPRCYCHHFHFQCFYSYHYFPYAFVLSTSLPGFFTCRVGVSLVPLLIS